MVLAAIELPGLVGCLGAAMACHVASYYSPVGR